MKLFNGAGEVRNAGEILALVPEMRIKRAGQSKEAAQGV